MQLIKRFADWDLSLLLRMIGLRSRPGLTPTALCVSHSGDGYMQALCIVTAGASGSAVAQKFAFTLCVLFIIERITYLFLKNISKRDRPPARFPNVAALIKASDRFSFPSGHTSAAFLLAACVIPIWPLLGVVFLVWAVCVGLSRVFLGVHYPSDIVAGAALGAGIFLLLQAPVGALF